MKALQHLVTFEDVVRSSKTSVSVSGRYGAHRRIFQLFNYSVPSAPDVVILIFLATFTYSHTAAILHRKLHLGAQALE